jgi:hypothetical protein
VSAAATSEAITPTILSFMARTQLFDSTNLAAS